MFACAMLPVEMERELQRILAAKSATARNVA
jgi:hypothetical protein